MRDPRILILTAVLLGCGGSSPSGTGVEFVLEDSAGVVVARNFGESRDTLVLDGPPRLDLGVADGEPTLLFSGVVAAAVAPSGEIVVANAGTSELRFFSPAGDFVRSIGRRGEGPGEFVGLRAVFVRGDSLVAHDQRNFRFTIFGPDLEVARMTAPGAFYLGMLRDGTLVSYDVARDMPGPGTVTRSRAVLRAHAPGAPAADTISRFDLNESYVHTEIPGFSERMFGRRTQVLFYDDRILLADNARYDLREMRADGSVSRSIQRDRPLRTVTGPDVEAYIDASGARYDDDPRREMFDRTLRDQPPPATMPAFGRSGLLRAGLPTVLRGSVGDLWVLEYVAFPGQPQAWSVFDPDGRLTRTVILPPGVELAHVGSDVLIAVTLDALDVEHVLVYDFAGLVPTGD